MPLPRSFALRSSLIFSGAAALFALLIPFVTAVVDGTGMTNDLWLVGGFVLTLALPSAAFWGYILGRRWSKSRLLPKTIWSFLGLGATVTLLGGVTGALVVWFSLVFSEGSLIGSNELFGMIAYGLGIAAISLPLGLAAGVLLWRMERYGDPPLGIR